MSQNQFNEVPKKSVSETPSEMGAETPLETPADVGQLSGGEYQQFSSETAASKLKRETGRGR